MTALDPSKPYRLAVVGSRDFPDASMALVAKFINKLAPNFVIVSGDARGVDKYAVACAKKRGLAVEEFPADWEAHGKAAGFLRNEAMIRTVHGVCAFWNKRSRGTADAISKARNWNKHLRVFDPDGNQLDPKRVLRDGRYARAMTDERPDGVRETNPCDPKPSRHGRGWSRRSARNFQRKNRN